MQTYNTNKSHLLLAAGAFVVGVVATAGIMSRRTSPRENSTVAPVVSAEKKGEKSVEKDAKPGEPKVVKLSEEAVKTAGIRVEPVKVAPFGENLSVPGTVEVSANRGAKVTPPTPGKIVRLLAQPGDVVRAGQALAVIDSFEVAQAQAAVRLAEAGIQQTRSGIQIAGAETDQARAGVRQSEAEVEQARTRQRSAQTALKRQQDLAAAGVFSQPSLQAAESEVSTAQAELSQAKNALQTQTLSFQRAERLFTAELVARAELEQTQAEQQRSRTEVERAQNRLSTANQTVERERKIAKAGLLNAREVQTAEAEVRAAQADVQKALQSVSRAQQDVRRASKGEAAARTALRGAESGMAASRANLAALAGTGAGGGGLVTIAAPIGGTVTERQATLGQAVDRAAVLFVIENLNTVLVNAHVPENDVARVRIGSRVEVTVPAYPRERFLGVVQSVAGSMDEKTRSLPVRCLVENPRGYLRPDMFAKVNLTVGSRSNGLVVPASALDTSGEKPAVYVEEGGGFARREVSVGRRTETSVEITSGLKQDERVVVDGVFILKSEGKKGELKEND